MTSSTNPGVNPEVATASSDDPDEIRRNIDATRRELSSDVQALADKVSPSQIVQRRTEAAKSKFTGIRDKVMGSASDMASHASSAGSSASSSVSSSMSGAASSVSGAASSLSDTVSSAPSMVQARAQGNPLAAGVIAFGVGWLVSSLLPASQKEQQLVRQAKDQATPLVDHLSSAGAEMKQNLAGTAQEAVGSLKQAATEAASTVADEGRSAAADVTEQAKQSKDTVQSAG
jgi:hypothetical protein